MAVFASLKAGLPRSGKNTWKTKFFPGQGKVGEFCKWSGKFRKDLESQGKSRVTTVRENTWKMKFFPGQGKVREFCKWSEKFRKDLESQGKVREFEKKNGYGKQS